MSLGNFTTLTSRGGLNKVFINHCPSPDVAVPTAVLSCVWLNTGTESTPSVTFQLPLRLVEKNLIGFLCFISPPQPRKDFTICVFLLMSLNTVFWYIWGCKMYFPVVQLFSCVTSGLGCVQGAANPRVCKDQHFNVDLSGKLFQLLYWISCLWRRCLIYRWSCLIYGPCKHSLALWLLQSVCLSRRMGGI